MIALSKISALPDWPGPGQLTLTDGRIAVLNLQAQIDGLEGRGIPAEAATLIDLLILRGLFLGRISDYERAAKLSESEVGPAITDPAAYVARARTRAVFHRFTEALDDLDHADLISPQEKAANQDRAAILQAMGHYDEALVIYVAADRRGKFEQAAALAGLCAERGETDTAQRFYLESLRTYRGVSPFPLALLDFQLGVMWMRHKRLNQARAHFEAAIGRVPAYAAAQGHLAEVEAHLGNPEAGLTRLYPLVASSDDPDYAAQLARIRGEMGHNDEASGWCRLAANRYHELTAAHCEAFADHAAEFWLGPGNDPLEGLRLAMLNVRVRKTPRAHELLAQALDAIAPAAGSARCSGAHLPNRAAIQL
jgi:tetratricopeptide (TPR) repeat protein